MCRNSCFYYIVTEQESLLYCAEAQLGRGKIVRGRHAVRTLIAKFRLIRRMLFSACGTSGPGNFSLPADRPDADVSDAGIHNPISILEE